MSVRPIKVWNASASAWQDVGTQVAAGTTIISSTVGPSNPSAYLPGSLWLVV